MDKAFVLDCSTTISWILEDEKNPKAEALKKKLLTAKAKVPSLWLLEVGNVLMTAERRKRISEADIFTALQFLETLPIEIDKLSSTRAFGNVVHLAREYNLTSYDACYLELAMHYNIPLATLDTQLNKAAIKAGVKTL